MKRRVWRLWGVSKGGDMVNGYGAYVARLIIVEVILSNAIWAA